MLYSEYINYICNPEAAKKARILTFESYEDLVKLQLFYRQDMKAVEIRISELFAENTIVMPPEFFLRLKAKIQNIGIENAIFIVGFSEYLKLLSQDNRESAIILLKGYFEETKQQEIVFACSFDADLKKSISEVFKNPRYEHAKEVVHIQGTNPEQLIEGDHGKIVLVSDRYSLYFGEECCLLKDYLSSKEKNLVGKSLSFVQVHLSSRQAGLCSSIIQVLSHADVVKAVYGIEDSDLSSESLVWICENGKNYCCGNGQLNLFPYFFPNGSIGKNVLSVFEQSTQSEKELLFWVIKQNAPHKSYLEYVIADLSVTPQNFRSAYITKPVMCLEKFSDFAEERKSAIAQVHNISILYADLQGFIALCTDKLSSEVFPWLNCGATIEKVEILRRCAQEKFIYEEAKTNYPALSAYMNSDIVYENTALTEYFKEYRKSKVINHISQEFAEKSFQAKVPENIKSRDAILQQFSQDNECALLVVDAMGAEWLPMLLTIAKEHNIGREFFCVGGAQLPSSTSFNKISWESARSLADIKRFDNIAHKGAEAYEKKRPEENLVAMLDVLSTEVLPRIIEGLGRFKKVLITADHGSSRLAVLANQQEFSIAKTLLREDDVDIADWRYCRPCGKKACPSELEETLDGNFWVVRGYNRLSKKGGGQGFEVHGGATLEERLVPIVVFSRTGQYEMPIVKEPERVQLIENDDFDL